jgi:hypothetical protein
MLWWALACGTPTPDPTLDPVFVRDGVIVSASNTQGRALSDGRTLIEEPWSPGQTVGIDTHQFVAPQVAECATLFHVPLENVDAVMARGAEPPDVSMAFSPNGDQLVVGSYGGQLRLVDGWNGRELARTQLSETLIREVAFSPDGQTVYVAEQSPDAYLHALDVPTLTTRWTVRLADDVGTSTPSADDLYGVYSLPAAYALEVLSNGDLLVAATHGWNDETGARRNQARVLRISAHGTREAAWPADGAADATFLSLAVHGNRAVVSISRSADGPPPELPINGLQPLSLPDLQPLSPLTMEPLGPWFSRVFVWDAVGVSSQQVAVGLGDGRLFSWNNAGNPVLEEPLGAPITVGDVPISASIGHLAMVGEQQVAAITSGTNIPYGATDPSLRPPKAHPKANALWVYDRNALSWSWSGEHSLQGLSVDENQRWLVVGAGARADQRLDLFGALIFDLKTPGTGTKRLRAICPTEWPVFFEHAVHRDGRVAVAEHPLRVGPGVIGDHRVTVLR